MSAVAIIPARGGSKGVKAKNLRKVGGISLVGRSILHAQACQDIGLVVVTSDSDEILEEAVRTGGTTVRLVKRPAELATDTANGDDVIVHALGAIGFNGNTPEDHLTVFLQPTCPIRRAGLISDCIFTLRKANADSLFTAHEGHFAWYRAPAGMVERGAFSDVLLPVRGGLKDRTNRQQIRPENRIYLENGCVYVSKTRELLKCGARLFGKIEMQLTTKEDSVDIDTEYDLWLAETRVKYLGKEEAIEDITESPVPAGYRP